MTDAAEEPIQLSTEAQQLLALLRFNLPASPVAIVLLLALWWFYPTPVLLILAHYHRTGQVVGVRLRLALVVLYVGYLPLAGIPEWFDWFRFQPVFLVPLGVCAWAIVLIRRQRRTRASC